MKNRLLCVCVLLIVFCGTSCARCEGQKNATKNDSLSIVSANWNIDTIADGVVFKKVHIINNKLFNSNQYICVLEILPQSKVRLAFAHRPVRTLTSEIARDSNALAAVNGSFFDMEKHNPICYLRIGGKQVGENTPQMIDTSNRKYY